MATKRGRTTRREAARAAEKLANDRERLARAEPGGSPKRPRELASASQVEPYALALGCARCGSPLRLDEHTAEEIDGARLRVVHAKCTICGTPRLVYVKLAVKLPN